MALCVHPGDWKEPESCSSQAPLGWINSPPLFKCQFVKILLDILFVDHILPSHRKAGSFQSRSQQGLVLQVMCVLPDTSQA